MQKSELENVDEGHGRTVAVSKGPEMGVAKGLTVVP